MSATLNEDGLYEQDIDGTKYEFQKWGAEDSLRTLLRIGKIAGKPFGILLSAVLDGKDPSSLFDDKLSPELNGDLLGQAFEALSQSMEESVCFELIKKLCTEKVMAGGVPVKNFDQHYRDKLMHSFNVARAALEVQYGSFFGAILGGVRLSKRRPASTLAPSTQTLPSGG